MASSSLLASIEKVTDFQYFGGNENYPVKLTGAKISLTPVADGKLIIFNVSAITDQVIHGGELMIDLFCKGVHFGSQKSNLCEGVTCPISVGNFVINFRQVLPVDVTTGSHSFKMTLVNQDGRQLSCAAFDFTIPFDPTIRYP